MSNHDKREVLGELKAIQASPILKTILAEHKQHLQKEVNSFVRQQRFTEAFGEVAKIDDLDKINELIKIKIEQLEKEE